MAVVVLFTCAGQRVDIVTAFARAGATTLAADVNELAPALYAAERRASVPLVDDPAYVDALRALVEEHDEDIGGRLSFKAINPKFLLKYDE